MLKQNAEANLDLSCAVENKFQDWLLHRDNYLHLVKAAEGLPILSHLQASVKKNTHSANRARIYVNVIALC